MRRGLYRIRGLNGAPDDIRVDDDGIEVPVAEQLYQNRGYRPPIADLPWEADYAPINADNDKQAAEAQARQERERERHAYQTTQSQKLQAPSQQHGAEATLHLSSSSAPQTEHDKLGLVG